eukprot:5610876-Pleurochrysis_carterae.AAC.1
MTFIITCAVIQTRRPSFAPHPSRVGNCCVGRRGSRATIARHSLLSPHLSRPLCASCATYPLSSFRWTPQKLTNTRLGRLLSWALILPSPRAAFASRQQHCHAGAHGTGGCRCHHSHLLSPLPSCRARIRLPLRDLPPKAKDDAAQRALEYLLAMPAFLSSKPQLHVRHVFGGANPMADACSRGHFQELHALCARLGVHPKRLDVRFHVAAFLGSLVKST